MSWVRDPVCDMSVDPASSLAAEVEGRTYWFCSEYCRGAFRADPGAHRPRAERPQSTEPGSRRIAYFTMEVGIDPAMPSYAGGLGVLAGDTLRTFADLRVPAVGVSLLYARGYFEQVLDGAGRQEERPMSWNPALVARMLPLSVSLSIGSRDIVVRAWQYEVRGAGGFVVPLLLLSTDAPENTSEDREITAALYAGDDSLRLRQEVVLGIGGLRMLRALGYANIERFHLNEGHASLVGVGLLREEREAGRPVGDDIEAVKRRTVFTTHTPVAAGHDRFLWPLVREVLGEVVPFDELVMLGGRAHLDMTSLGLNLSQRVNAVAKRHGEVTRQMFPGQDVEAITNGVHSFTWTCDSFRRLYDRHLPGWAADPFALRHAVEIPAGEVWSAHLGAKLALLDEVEARTGRRLSEDALTIGFARRATAYKRAPLVVGDTDRLRDIASRRGPIQLVFAGKAHPQDESGKEGIRAVFRAAERLAPDVAVAWLPELDLRLSRLMTAGVDVWLNTPLRPLEASGTSGMKAAHNGIPSLSVLDGWWIEGHLEGVTGWSIGPRPGEPIGDAAAQDRRDASDLYEKLGAVVAPLFYGDRRAWIDLMRRTIAVNASFFNTHRMVQQYATSAYL